MAYIARIRDQGETTGLAVIVSPLAPSVFPARVLSNELGMFTARWQPLGRQLYTDWEAPLFTEGEEQYTLKSFIREAERETAKWFGGFGAAPPPRTVEVTCCSSENGLWLCDIS